MEQEKNKNGVIILLVVIIVILLALVILLATGTISFKSNKLKNDTSESNQIINTTNLTDNTINEKINRIIFTYSPTGENGLGYDFQVTQIDKLFVIFTHTKGKQCYPNNVTIINNNGETVKKFENVDFSYANNKITIKSSNNGQCMGPDVIFSTVEYIVDGSNLIEQ